MNLVMSKPVPICVSRYGVVSIRAGLSGVRLRANARDFSILQNVKNSFWVRPASCSLGTQVISPVVKRPEREVNRLCLLSRSEWVELHLSSRCMSSWREQCRFYLPLTLSCSDFLTVCFICQLSSLILLIGNCILVWWLRIPSIMAEKNHATPHSHPNANVSEISVTAIASSKIPKVTEKDYTLITNLMHWLLFIHKILFSSTCFEHQVLIFRRT